MNRDKLYLVGFMGAGKTPVERALGRRLGWRVADVDDRIEALTLAEAAGVDARQLPQCLAGGHADSSLLKHLYPQMHARDFEPPRSYARQLLKDLKAVTAYAHELELSLPMLEAATRRYTDYVGQGNGMKDTASIVNSYRPAA